jgi:chromosome segregation ATPase
VIGLAVGAFAAWAARSEGVRKVLVTLINYAIKGFELVVNAVIDTVNSFIQWGNIFNGILRFVGINIGNLEPIARKSFGGISTAINGATDAAAEFANKMENARQKIRNLDEKGLVSVADATNRVKTAQEEVNRLRKLSVIPIEQLKKAVDNLKDSESELALITGDKVGGAVKKAVKPLEEYTKVLKQAQAESDAFGRAQRRVRDSNVSLTEANEALTFARAELERVQRSGSEAEIADATRALAAAERTLARSQFGREEAAIAVRDAEKRLADIRKDEKSTPDEIRRAEIALAESKFAIADAEDNQVKSAKDLDEARRQLRITTEGLKQGDEELLPFQKAVTDAQKAQTKAAEDYRDALKEQTDALKEYKDALKELADAAGKFPGVAGKIGAPGLIPTVPGVPEPVPVYTPAQESQLAQLNVTVQAGLATDGAEVGRIIADYLRDFTRIAGPLQAYGLVT